MREQREVDQSFAAAAGSSAQAARDASEQKRGLTLAASTRLSTSQGAEKTNDGPAR